MMAHVTSPNTCLQNRFRMLIFFLENLDALATKRYMREGEEGTTVKSPGRLFVSLLYIIQQKLFYAIKSS